MTPRQPKIHLVTFGTPKYYLRQYLFGLSATINGVVDTVTAWNPKKLDAAGFYQRVPEISLSERGAGYWSWKPFIIQDRLNKVPEGDIVLYCDVGRFFPYRSLEQSLAPFLAWMEGKGQEIMPGVLIPWHGPMSTWTKRDAFFHTEMDRDEIHRKTPIEATFSIWKSGIHSKRLVSLWMKYCSERRLLSDDPSACGLAELADFKQHRHDQSLLSLCCFKEGIEGIYLGETMPNYDYRTPTEVSRILWPEQKTQPALQGKILKVLISCVDQAEKITRRA